MRRSFLLHYSVKPESVERNLELVRAVFAEIEVAQPAGIHYATFLHEDGVSFVNFVATETEAGLAPLARLASYREIQASKHKRFAEPPVGAELTEIGAYRIFGETTTPDATDTLEPAADARNRPRKEKRVHNTR